MQDKVDSQHRSVGADPTQRGSAVLREWQRRLRELEAEKESARRQAEAMSRLCASREREVETLRAALARRGTNAADLPVQRHGAGRVMRFSAAASMVVTAAFITVTAFHDAQTMLQITLARLKNPPVPMLVACQDCQPHICIRQICD